MRRLTVLAAAILLNLAALNAAPQFGRVQDRGRNADRVCIFRDIGFQGVEQCFNPGDSVRSLDSLNGQASSIRIYGRASITVWDDTDFRGHSTIFSSSQPDLGQVRLESKSWNDRIQSLQIGTGGGGGGIFGREQNTIPFPGQQAPANTAPIAEGICVYDHPNYEGRSTCWSGNQELSDLGRSGGWSDKIYSIRVFGRTSAVVYRDIGFRGASMVVDRDIPDLSQLGGNGFRDWGRQISSIQIGNRGGRDRFGERDRRR